MRYILFFLLCVSAGGAAYPLRVASGNRHLEDQNGVPFFIHADSAWEIIENLTNAQVEQYLDDRRARGLNTLICELIEHQFSPSPPANTNGDVPFSTPGDFSTPNETYFAHADYVINRCAAKGIQVVLFPCYLGFEGTSEGWISEAVVMGTTGCNSYGQYVGNRYKTFPNIIWAMVGDRDPTESPDSTALVNAMVAGILANDTSHLVTAHCKRHSDPRSFFPGQTWLTLNASYSADPNQTYNAAAYNDSPAMPFFLIEGWYEGEHSITGPRARAQGYTTMLQGGCGQTFGNLPIWDFGSGWETAMQSDGSISMRYLGNLFRSRAWHKLVPDLAHAVVTAGYSSGTSYVPCARTSDGVTVIAYLPASSSAITVDMTKVSGANAKATWFNPRAGSAAVDGTYATSGTHSFTPPDANDWVLVLDDASTGQGTPGVSANISATSVSVSTVTISP